MGASFEERRARLRRMIALRKAIDRAEQAYQTLLRDTLAEALGRVDEVEAHAAEIAAERDALRDRLAETERELDEARATFARLEGVMPHPSHRTGVRCARCGRDGAPHPDTLCMWCDEAGAMEREVESLRDRLGRMEARLAAARKATDDLPRHLGASSWGQQLRAALTEVE